MSQEYNKVVWQDETTSQQGTLINAERLDQMQTAHHYADGFEEVDTAPTADPGVDYHKVVYCTADSTFYRWDGTEWTKDIDDDTKALLLAHEADHANPHQVTKAQVGLGNADNTSDQNKPVSTAQAAAIKLVQDYLDAHEANHSNPHAVTKAQVGLGNADNTSDADKPISTAAQTALDGKVSIIPVTTGVKFYAQTSGGTSLYQGTANAQTGITSVPLRDSSGRIKTETPSADTDCANKKYADDGLATKADKATTLAGYGITDAYTKTETDTLLASKADDNAVVHLAGAETIPGVKTFTTPGGLIANTTSGYNSFRIKARGQSSSIGMYRKNADDTAEDLTIEVGSYYNNATTQYAQLKCYAPRVTIGDTDERQYYMRSSIFSKNDGTGQAYLTALGTDGNAKELFLGLFDGLTWKTKAPTPGSSAEATEVATVGYVSQTGDTAPNNLLHKSGNEYIIGQKIAGSTCGIRTPFKRDESPTSTLNSPSIIFTDEDNHNCFQIMTSKEANGNMRAYFTLYNSVEGVVKNAALRFSITAQNQAALQIIDTSGNYHTIALY